MDLLVCGDRISCAPQSENQSRASCQRGDSPIARPVKKVAIIGVESDICVAPYNTDTHDALKSVAALHRVAGVCLACSALICGVSSPILAE